MITVFFWGGGGNLCLPTLRREMFLSVTKTCGQTPGKQHFTLQLKNEDDNLALFV